MRTLMLGFLTVITLGAGMEAAAQTPEERTALRNVAVKHGDAVVRVLATRKMRRTINGREQSSDQAVQTNATMLDGTGLAVAALSEFEAPDGLTAALQATAPAGTTISMSTETTDLKMHLADGREVPAKIVLRDADLDLMFIRPAEPLSSAPVVDTAADVAWGDWHRGVLGRPEQHARGPPARGGDRPDVFVATVPAHHPNRDAGRSGRALRDPGHGLVHP